MKRELPPELLADLNAALTIMSARSPEHAHEIERMRRAIQQDSPVLYRRFHVLTSNILNGPARDEMTTNEKREIGHCLVALSEMQALGQPGPKARGNEYRLMVYLTHEENEELNEFSQATKTTKAEIVRRALRAHLAANSVPT
jgi:hypothetical protein